MDTRTHRVKQATIIMMGILHLLAIIGILIKVVPVWDRLDPLVITALLSLFVLGTIAWIRDMVRVFRLKDRTHAGRI